MCKTLDEIYTEKSNITREYLRSVGQEYDDDNIKTKLIASILVYNSGRMAIHDKFYVENKDFNTLYMMDQGQIESVLLNENITCPHVVIRGVGADKIYVLKQIINARSCKQHKDMLINKRRAKQVAEFNEMEFGDIMNELSELRYVNAFIMGYNSNLISNPDFSNSGYLTIPIEITKHLNNAYEFYNDIINDPDISSIIIEFKHDDEYIVKLFGKELNVGDDIHVEFVDGNDEWEEVTVNGKSYTVDELNNLAH